MTPAERAARLVRVSAYDGGFVIVVGIGQVESQVFSANAATVNAGSLRAAIAAEIQAAVTEAVVADREACAAACEAVGGRAALILAEVIRERRGT